MYHLVNLVFRNCRFSMCVIELVNTHSITALTSFLPRSMQISIRPFVIHNIILLFEVIIFIKNKTYALFKILCLI